MMGRIKEKIAGRVRGIALAGLRFPMTVFCLLVATCIIFRMIAINEEPELLQKLLFTFVIGAVLSVVTEFVIERFANLSSKKVLVYGVAILLTLGYSLILLPAPEISEEIFIRSFVAILGLICVALWLPSYRSEVNFNCVALVHFKAFFTALLYAIVLSLGIAAIIGSIHILLFDMNNDLYAYIMTVIWVIFAPVYYLSLLPRFNSEAEEDKQRAAYASSYPKFLDILISYIAIPLVSAYTFILFAYFIKILVKFSWPSGQVAPMVLVYAIVGLVVFVLASLLQNKGALLYRKLFPKLLIVVVIMQHISVGIRLNSYGVTVSRYYVVLFGVYALIAAILLSFSPASKNGRIAILAALFALVSIFPFIDAFSVSRSSQIHRLEKLLKNEGMLEDGKLISKEGASENTKREVTSILNYLEGDGSLTYIHWLPEEFSVYYDMASYFGFDPTYKYDYGDERKYYYASVERGEPLVISDYDMILEFDNQSYQRETIKQDFVVSQEAYQLVSKRTSDKDVSISILDASGKELVTADLYPFLEKLLEEGKMKGENLPLETLSYEVVSNQYKLKIIFQNINYTEISDAPSEAGYVIYVLFGKAD